MQETIERTIDETMDRDIDTPVEQFGKRNPKSATNSSRSNVFMGSDSSDAESISFLDSGSQSSPLDVFKNEIDYSPDHEVI